MGSLTLAEFTSVFAWLVRPPLMRINPSGPRTTPGSNGRASWKSWLSCMTDFRILAVSIGAPPELDVVSTVGASAVTVTFCVSPFSFSWKSSFAGASDLTVTCW